MLQEMAVSLLLSYKDIRIKSEGVGQTGFKNSLVNFWNNQLASKNVC
jgi:hypothetical protein